MKQKSMLKIMVIGLVVMFFCFLPGSKEASAAQATYTPVMGDYCVQPPFLSGYVPPQVLFTLGKDHKFYYPAYNDASDIDNDGQLETSYKHSFDYYGYFDAKKCYSYSSGVFIPFGVTSDKYCSATNCTNSSGTAIDCSGKFSGNFLNWAAMSRADVVKMVIYGGYRTSDNNGTNYAEVSGEFIPQDGHVWGKEYLGADAAKLFAGGVNNQRALFCVKGATVGGKGISKLNIIPDVSAISGTPPSGGLRAWHWINVDGNADICSDSKIDFNADGSAEAKTLTGLAAYNVSVKVCDPADGYNSVGDWERKHCKNYSSATPQDANGPWRPVGLMQVYGETPNSTKVCSQDMVTACNNDGDCSGSGNGQCVNASNMFFGMIAGSFQNPKAGGFIRKDIYSINEETNQSNGILQTSASSGKGLLMKSIEELKCPTTYPLSTHLGNPIGEILYEGLRYWAGRGTPTAAFVNSISGSANGDNSNYASKPDWDTPATLYPSCSIPFNLVFSDIYNSFDHDQVPGSAFASVTGDLTGFDAATLANTIWTNEALGTPLVIGESGTTSGVNTDGRCGGKTVTGLGNVKGICPAEGNQSGSYYAAAAALYGHNSMKTQMDTPNVLTYVVAFNSNVPEIRVFTGAGTAADKSVLVEPYGKSVSNSYGWNCTTTNTDFATADKTTAAGSTTRALNFIPKAVTPVSNCPTLNQVSFYVLESEYNGLNQLKYIKYRVATDDLGGTDFDLDMLTEYTVCAYGATNSACTALGLTSDQVSVKVERAYSSAGNPAAFGFTIVGAGADSGTYMIVQHTSAPPGGTWSTSPLPTTSASMKFLAAGSATLPKPPLWYAAKYGGFKDSDSDGLPFTDATCSYALTNSSRNPKCNEWSSKIPGVPDNYFEVSNPSEMETKLRDALESILARVSSGTAASILNNSEGSGASLLQAVFYPKKDFDGNTSVNWIGEIHNMWYYLDPFFNSTIREDSIQDYKLNITQDKIAQFYFDSDQSKTLVRLFSDTNGDGNPDLTVADQTVDPDNVKSLWKAGRKLWARTLTTAPRTIYTNFNTTAGNTPQKFSSLDVDGYLPTWTGVQNILQVPPGSGSAAAIAAFRTAKATKLIDWVHGTDQLADADGTKYRSRKVTIDACSVSGSGCVTSDSIYTREWKLGDIVSATPKLVSNNPLNGYNKAVPNGYADKTYDAFVNTTAYKNRGMVFVGANDGMLHAFRLGVLKETAAKAEKAQFNNSAGTLATSADDLGKEEWAFIPKHVLPYLTYLANPDYCHLFTVDKSPSLADVSVATPAGCSVNYWNCPKAIDGSTWKTILVGGMGIGGAAKWNGTSALTAPDSCIKTPLKGADATVGTGYSSYYALDVTDPTAPKYLWEFPGTSSAAGLLGSSTTGPAIVRIAAHTDAIVGGINTRTVDNSKNGRWFAVFASGSTGPIDTVKREFKGQSDQQLRIFVVDMADGTLVRTIDKFANGITALPADAFAGSLSTSWVDTDRATISSVGWYSDDAVYIGYTRKCTATDLGCTTGTWTKGGVLRLTTGENTDPANWKVSTVIDGTGPVTTSVTKLQDRRNSNFWLYFGTGRYFFKGDDATTNTQTLYGIKEPCYATTDLAATGTDLKVMKNSINPYCTSAVSGTLADQSGAPTATIDSAAPGWKLTLDAPASGFSTERVITDPVASPAGAVFFTTFKPSLSVCRFGGDTLIWALAYDTGGVPPSRAMKGKALLQVSTGAFAELSLATAFSNPGDSRLDGRRLSSPVTGVPPTAQGLSLITNPPPVKKILHIREK